MSQARQIAGWARDRSVPCLLLNNCGAQCEMAQWENVRGIGSERCVKLVVKDALYFWYC